MSAHRFTRKTLPQALAACGTWLDATNTTWSDEAALRYTRLKELIQKYLKWEPMTRALNAYAVTHEQLLRALNRCVALADDGKPYGWRALLPYCHTIEYTRHCPVRAVEALTRGGYAGALGALFVSHPDIQAALDEYLLCAARPDSLPESKVRLHAAHRYFLKLCEGIPILPNQWPFCTEQLGAGAIADYVQKFWVRHYDEIVERQFGDKAKAKSKTGRGIRSRLMATLPYDIVELDEHKAHFIGSIGIPSPKGIRWCPIRRVTLILLVDRVSGVALGYSIVFRREARAHDVTRAISNAVGPTPLRVLSLEGLTYPDGSGFPSGSIPACERCGWNLLLIDNALIHFAHEILGRVRATLGCGVNFGAVRRFERRPIAELVFNELSRAGFHRLESTTGSHTQDPLRKNAEHAAVKHRMSLEAILDLIELVIANYNAKQGKTNFGIGGLDYLRDFTADSSIAFLPPTLPKPVAGDVPLHIAIEPGRVAGSIAKGVRPYIALDEVAYTNPSLANRWDLIGERVVRHIDEANLQHFDAYLTDGRPLGAVTAGGRWKDTPHSREARRQINALIRSGELVLQRGEDPVVAWLKALADAAVKKNPNPVRPKVTAEASQLAEEMRQNAIDIPMAQPEGEVPCSALPAPSASEGAKRAPMPSISIAAVN
jgi:hypothetical protein